MNQNILAIVAKLTRWAGFEPTPGHLSGGDYVHPQSGAMVFLHDNYLDLEWYEFGEKFAKQWKFTESVNDLSRMLVRMDRRKPEEPLWMNHPDGTSTPFGGKQFRPNQ